MCPVDKGTRLGIDAGEALAAIYFIITCALLLRKLSYLKKLPYSGVKRGLVYFTIQVLTAADCMHLAVCTAAMQTVFILCTAILPCWAPAVRQHQQLACGDCWYLW